MDNQVYTEEKLKEVNIPDIKKGQLKILQLNIGYMCNQTCSHCHVDAGPSRKEMMSMEVLSMCLEPVSYTHLTLPTNREV